MNRFLPLTFVTLVAFGVPAAHAQSTAAVRRQIQAAYDSENAAAARKDMAGLFAHEAPDFKATTKQGKTVTLADLKTQILQLTSIAKSIHAATKIISLTVAGKSATVLADDDAVLVMPSPQTGKISKFEFRTKSQDTWIKGSKGWLRRASNEIGSSASVDGKPLPGGM